MNVDSVSIVFVEMLAILDMLIAVSYSLPVAVTLFAKKYILGQYHKSLKQFIGCEIIGEGSQILTNQEQENSA